MKIAVIGQSLFAVEVVNALRANGHEIVGVFTIPDKDGRADPLALAAEKMSIPVHKFRAWRFKAGTVIPKVFEEYKAAGAELNVLPYCSQFIPIEVTEWPRNKSIVYHPSVLPRHRGAAAINWTLIQGDAEAGFTVFWADEGLDTGPILLQKSCPVEPNDTVETLYNRFLFPEGIRGVAEAVELIAAGKAPRLVQPIEGASYEPMVCKKESSRILFDDLTGQEVHNFIRGLDSVPGAWAVIDEGVEVKVFGSKLHEGPVPSTGISIKVEGMSHYSGLVHAGGLLLFGRDGSAVNVSRLLLVESGKMIPAAKYGQDDRMSEVSDLEMSEQERDLTESIRKIWEGILRIPADEITNETDFFKSGAGSMDVTRLVEEVRDRSEVDLANEDVYMATTFGEFSRSIVLKTRGGCSGPQVTFEPVVIRANNREIHVAKQLFINNQFVDSCEPYTGRRGRLQIVNPTDESLICEVESAAAADVDRAVSAASVAFEEWSRTNARDRGRLLYKLADLMEANLEELATLESVDSGAVYTLALKTHIGMSIDTFRYFAGWADKLEGATIPINNARPARNWTITRREPLGVCGLITPWNYPLMMVAWKLAPCLAAGNTVVIKPAQVCPLTSLKLAELIVYAGFPPGVVNFVTGTGSVTGQAICDHPFIRKVGFTGSTPIGKVVMRSCADTVKRVSLELGGKSPLIIFADADLDRAVRHAMSAVFFNKGENCIAAGRIFVEETIQEEFVRRVLGEIAALEKATGDPLDRSTAHGPQNHRAHLDKLVEYCKRGVREGAQLITGGRRMERPGLFFAPTLFTRVTDEMYIAREESFGPVMIVSSFPAGDVDDVLRRANATEFGLASGVFTRDIQKALTVADRISAGTCFVNCYNKTDVAAPFGGFKQSGFGKDLGREALHEYTRVKTTTIEF